MGAALGSGEVGGGEGWRCALGAGGRDAGAEESVSECEGWGPGDTRVCLGTRAGGHT